MGITEIYKSFLKFHQRVSKLKLGNSWSIDFSDSFITISSYANDYLLPEFEIFVDPSLWFSLHVSGWLLTDDQDLYRTHGRSFANVTL